MIELQQAINDISADQLASVNFDSPQWQLFEDTHKALFARVQNAKPNSPMHSLLLGLLTKAHIETITRVSAHTSSVQAMNHTLKQELGKEHAANFHYQDGEQLVLVTHLWLYLQGYLVMDFSLANDHALQSATALCNALGGDIQQQRSEFMASFYLGKQVSPQRPSHSLLTKLKQFFS